MFHWKRRMLKAQGDLQHEMRGLDYSLLSRFEAVSGKYERDGLVDVSKMAAG